MKIRNPLSRTRTKKLIQVAETLGRIQTSTGIRKLETALGHDSIRHQLNPGAGADSIALIGQTFGFELSASLIELYEWHNGAKKGATDFSFAGRFLPVEEGTMRFQRVFDEVQALPAEAAAVKELVSFQREWVPIFDGAVGTLFWSPSLGERVFMIEGGLGQIWIFPDLGNFLAATADFVASGLRARWEEDTDIDEDATPEEELEDLLEKYSATGNLY